MQTAAPDQVQVEVEHRLTGARPYVDHCPVSILDAALPGQMGGHQLAAANDIGILGDSFFQSADMFLGDNEYMSRRLGVNVLKGEGVVVFIDFAGGYLAPNNAAEQAVTHDTSSL